MPRSTPYPELFSPGTGRLPFSSPPLYNPAILAMWSLLLFWPFGLLASCLSPVPSLLSSHGLIQFSGPSHSGLFQMSLLLHVFSLISTNKNLDFLEAVMSFLFIFLPSISVQTHKGGVEKEKKEFRRNSHIPIIHVDLVIDC